MITTLAISTITFLPIAISLFLFPKIKIGKFAIATYWLIALVGATILLLTQQAPIQEVFNELTADTKVNPLKILVLFFSMTLISIFLDEFGLFKYLAGIAVKKAKGNQFTLFFALYALTSVLTVFTSNDIVILTLTPFICFFAKRTKINPIPYLIAEFTAANTWSLMFVIGNPTNIFLATSAGIDFVNYLKVMALPTVGAGLVEIIILFLLFRKKLKEPLGELEEQEENKIENKALLIIGVIHLLICLVFLIISSYIGLEMWLIALISASSLLIITSVFAIVKKKKEYVFDSVKKLPYPLIPFFLSMFVIVVALNYQGVSTYISELFGNTNVIWVYGYSSFFMSNVINNIPMSILYANLCNGLTGINYTSAIYASIIGSNIGAFLTPMGALAGIMFTGLVNEHNVKFSFVDFIKYGVIIAIPTITVSLALLLVTL